MPDSNPYLAPALDAATDKVADSLTFLITRVLTSQDPAQVYAEDLIRAVAAAPEKAAREAERRLKARFTKDMNLLHWRRDVRDAKTALVSALPSALLRGANDSIKSILANAIIQLRNSPLKVAYDSFAARVTIQGTSPWGTDGPWRDIDDIAAANHLQHNAVSVGSAVANEAAYFIAFEHQYHPVRDWLAGLAWDGTPRLDTWMSDYLGAPGTDYTHGIASKWAISAVARAMRPGCKADYMIVLEGPQRQGKSRALRALTNGHLDGDTGVQWFRDALPDIEKDDIGLYMQGVWIIEIAELEAIRGKQWTKVKAFISSQTDNFRRKFGRNMQDYPRQCIFAASTNETNWGGDPTGLTRFWPVRAEKINVDGLLRWRDQIWAEARSRYDEGETWWLDEVTEKLARAEQAERSPEDSWIERVENAVDKLMAFGDDVSVSDVLSTMGIAAERQGQIEANRCVRVLTSMGWERVQRRVEGKRVRRYRKAEV